MVECKKELNRGEPCKRKDSLRNAGRPGLLHAIGRAASPWTCGPHRRATGHPDRQACTPVRSTVDGEPARFRGPRSLAGDELVQTQDRAADLTPGRPLASASPGCETLELRRVKLPGQFGFLR